MRLCTCGKTNNRTLNSTHAARLSSVPHQVSTWQHLAHIRVAVYLRLAKISALMTAALSKSASPACQVVKYRAALSAIASYALHVRMPSMHMMSTHEVMECSDRAICLLYCARALMRNFHCLSC